MRYTLDSLAQVEQSLEEVFKGSRIQDQQVIFSGADLLQMTEENPRAAYFGVLTIPQGTVAVLTNRGDEVITVEGGNQIIEFFTKIEFLDEAGVGKVPAGQFRGATIQILD